MSLKLKEDILSDELRRSSLRSTGYKNVVLYIWRATVHWVKNVGVEKAVGQPITDAWPKNMRNYMIPLF